MFLSHFVNEVEKERNLDNLSELAPRLASKRLFWNYLFSFVGAIFLHRRFCLRLTHHSLLAGFFDVFLGGSGCLGFVMVRIDKSCPNQLWLLFNDNYFSHLAENTSVSTWTDRPYQRLIARSAWRRLCLCRLLLSGRAAPLGFLLRRHFVDAVRKFANPDSLKWPPELEQRACVWAVVCSTIFREIRYSIFERRCVTKCIVSFMKRQVQPFIIFSAHFFHPARRETANVEVGQKSTKS